MKNVYLAYKAYDAHELLCHAIADFAGLYDNAGLAVTLLDTTFTPDDALPETTFYVACGAALASFLTGKQRKVVFVACDRPMFWLYGKPGLDSMWAVSVGAEWKWKKGRAIQSSLSYMGLGDAPVDTPSIPGIGSATGEYTSRDILIFTIGISFGAF